MHIGEMATQLVQVLEWSVMPLGLYVACVLPSALLLVTTPKRSPLRFLCAAALGCVAYQFCLAASSVTTGFVINTMVMGQGMFGLLHCFNLLLIASLDEADLVRATIFKPSATFATKVGSAFALLINYRGIGTPWQAKHVRPFPSFYKNRGSRTQPSWIWYIVRQSLIIAWQYILLDIIGTSSVATPDEETARLFGPGTEYKYLSATPEQWAGRFFVGVVGWFIPARTVLDLSTRIACLLLVAIGIFRPEECPPTFGTMADAYTLRQFWSKLWHQFMRWPLTSISNFLTRDVLRLPRPSILERYTNIYFVFLGSGIFHHVHATFIRPPTEESNSILFFSSFALGIMIEDGVQEAWRRLSGQPAKTKVSSPPLWQKVVGFIWVAAWLMITSPWYLYPDARLPVDSKWIVPISVVEKVGMNTAVAILAVGGLFSKFVLGGEL